MDYKLPDNGFNRFLLYRGKRKLGIWIIPGKTVSLEPKDVAELAKLGISAIPHHEKPKRSIQVSQASQPEMISSKPVDSLESTFSPDEPIDIDAIDFSGDDME